MSRARRVLAGVAIAPLALAVLAGGGAIFLTTAPGERLMRDVLVSQIESAIAGRVQIGRVELAGDGLVLHDVVLRTPDGERVASAGRVHLDVALGALIAGRLRLDRLDVSDLVVSIRRRGETWNVAAAVEPAAPRERPTSFAIEELVLRGGRLELRHGGRAPRVVAEDLSATGRLARDAGWRGRLDLRGRLAAPARGPFHVTASVDGDASLEDLAVAVALDVSRFEHAGYTYGPLRFAGRLADGRLEVERARVELPGLQLAREPAGAAAFAGTLEVRSLETAMQALGALLGRDLPALRGRGRLAVRLANPIGGAGAAITGRFPVLATGAFAAHGLELDARLGPHPSLAVSAERVEAGDRRLGPVAVALGATRLRGDRLRLDRLFVAYPSAMWRARGPATVELGAPRIDGLVLVSGDQRIAIDAAWSGAARRVEARLEDVRVASLPAPLRSAPVELAGTIDGTVAMRRAPGGLAGRARLRITDWQLAPLAGPAATLDVTLAPERIEGTLSARTLGGAVTGWFEVPRAPSPDARVAARLALDALAMDELWPVIAELAPSIAARLREISGRLSGSVRIAGSPSAPVVHGAISVRGRGATLSAHGRARPLGEGLYAYHLALAARRFPLPAGAGLTASFEAKLRGRISPRRVTSRATFTDLRVVRAGERG